MNMLKYSMNAFIPAHGELALFLRKPTPSVSKRGQKHMMDRGLEGSCGDPGEEQSFKGIQSERRRKLRLFPI